MAEEAEILLKAKFENGQAVIDATKNINKNLDQMSKSADEAGKQTNNLLSYLKKIAAVVGIAAVANQFKNLVKGSLQAAGAMEQVNIALTTMLGSGEKAKKLTTELITFAKKTPFEIEGIFQTTKQLLAYGIAQDDIIPTMNTLGNIAAGVGVDMNRLALAYGQVKTTGRLLGQDLNQFTQAGVPLLAALASGLGKTEAEVLKLKEAGNISFAQVKAALEAMTQEGGKFFNLMENQSKTFLGTVSNMADSFYQVRVALGEALLPIAKKAVDSMIVWFGNLKTIIENNKQSITTFASIVATAFSFIGSALKIAFSLVANFIDGIKTLLKIPLVKEILAAAGAVLIFSKGLGGLTVAFRLLAAGAGGWIIAIVAATTAIGYLSKGIENMPNFIKTAALTSLRLFEQLKLAIFDFVNNILDKLGTLSGLPMFGWVDDAKKKFNDLEKSSLSNIQAINDEIANINTGKIEISSPEAITAPEIATSQSQLSISGDGGISRLDALKAENQALLLEQQNFLAGYSANQTESDAILAQNATLEMQNKILQDEQYVARKQELNQQLIDGEISNEQYKAELQLMSDEARNAALQMQYDQELVLFQENQLVKDEIKNEMQLTQDELELEQLQIQLAQKELFEQESQQRLATFKAQQNIQTYEQKKAIEIKSLQHTLKMDSDNYKAAQGAANELVSLQNSKNKSIAAIGKAAAMFQITNDTARGAIAAYASLAPIPFVGPSLGIAAAGAVIAYGAERLAGVAANSFAVGTPNIPQDQLANVHKGEMIIPATFSEAIRSGQLTLGANDNIDNSNSATITNININFDGAKFVGTLDNDDIVDIGVRLGQMIVEDVIPAIPTRKA